MRPVLLHWENIHCNIILLSTENNIGVIIYLPWSRHRRLCCGCAATCTLAVAAVAPPPRNTWRHAEHYRTRLRVPGVCALTRTAAAGQRGHTLLRPSTLMNEYCSAIIHRLVQCITNYIILVAYLKPDFLPVDTANGEYTFLTPHILLNYCRLLTTIFKYRRPCFKVFRVQLHCCIAAHNPTSRWCGRDVGALHSLHHHTTNLGYIHTTTNTSYIIISM